MEGTLRFQPRGLIVVPSLRGPTLTTASMTTASTVLATIEIKMAPLTPRT